jgi:quinol monooxygenase YgiN
MAGFFFYSVLVLRQASRSQGNLGVSVIRDADRVFWTRSVWTDEGAMRSFMRRRAHRRVMPHLAKWCDEAALAHWVQEEPELPTWPAAHQRLQENGRRSRVDHPSPAQRRFEIAPPRTSD